MIEGVDWLRLVRHVPLTAVGDASRLGELTPSEVARNARLRRPEDRAAHLAAHLLVREVVAELVGSGGGFTPQQRCPDCGAHDHGRPAIAGRPELSISLSHAVAARPGAEPEIAVAALAVRGMAGRPVGVDVEHLHAAVPSSALGAAERGLVAAGEHAARFWVAKEAAVKAGLGGLDDVGTWSVPDGLPGDPHLEWWADEQAVAAVCLPR